MIVVGIRCQLPAFCEVGFSLRKLLLLHRNDRHLIQWLKSRRRHILDQIEALLEPSPGVLKPTSKYINGAKVLRGLCGGQRLTVLFGKFKRSPEGPFGVVKASLLKRDNSFCKSNSCLVSRSLKFGDVLSLSFFLEQSVAHKFRSIDLKDARQVRARRRVSVRIAGQSSPHHR